MTSLAKARLHSIFPMEQKGDTLVITPQGDAIGFSPNQIQVEIRGVEKLLAESDGLNLIFDLEHTNYFGSEMIGFLSRMGAKARQRGGRIAMCNVSADMQGILDVMNFDAVWESYDSTRDAIRAIATIPIGERISAYRKPMCATLVIALIALGLAYYPWPNRNRDTYNRFMSCRAEIERMRLVGQTERSGIRKKMERELRPVIKELANDSENGDLGASFLYLAGKNSLLPLLSADGFSRAQLEREFAANMMEAAKYIPEVSAASDNTELRQPSRPIASSQQRIRSAEKEAPAHKR